MVFIFEIDKLMIYKREEIIIEYFWVWVEYRFMCKCRDWFEIIVWVIYLVEGVMVE